MRQPARKSIDDTHSRCNGRARGSSYHLTAEARHKGQQAAKISHVKRAREAYADLVPLMRGLREKGADHRRHSSGGSRSVRSLVNAVKALANRDIAYSTWLNDQRRLARPSRY